MAEGIEARGVSRRIKAVYGEHTLPLNRVQEWHKRFLERREAVNDDITTYSEAFRHNIVTSPSRCHIFGPLKKALKSRRFYSESRGQFSKLVPISAKGLL